jgi:hypothetical protein
LSSYRFFNVALFVLADLGATMMFSTFTPISKQITYIYDIDNNYVTATSNIILLLNMPLPFLGSYSKFNDYILTYYKIYNMKIYFLYIE